MRFESSQLGVRAPLPLVINLRFLENIPIGPPAYLMRVPSIAGLAALADLGPIDPAAMVNQDALSYMSSVGYNVEQGIAVSPSTFRQNILQDLTAMCAGGSWGQAAPRCTVPVDLIEQKTAEYAAALNSKQTTFAQQVAAGQVVVPQGNYYQQQQQQQQQQQSITPTVSVVNTSRPGQPFKVGDSFTLTVNGSPNQPVTGSGTQNGVSKGTTPYGNTNGSGQFQISGSFGADTVGNWTEVWTVGGLPSSTLSFSVAAATAANSGGSGSGSTNTGGGSTDTGSKQTDKSTATGGSTSFDFTAILDKLKAPSPVFGLPWGVVVGGVLVAVWLYSTRGKRG